MNTIGDLNDLTNDPVLLQAGIDALRRQQCILTNESSTGFTMSFVSIRACVKVYLIVVF